MGNRLEVMGDIWLGGWVRRVEIISTKLAEAQLWVGVKLITLDTKHMPHKNTISPPTTETLDFS